MRALTASAVAALVALGLAGCKDEPTTSGPESAAAEVAARPVPITRLASLFEVLPASGLGGEVTPVSSAQAQANFGSSLRPWRWELWAVAGSVTACGTARLEGFAPSSAITIDERLAYPGPEGDLVMATLTGFRRVGQETTWDPMKPGATNVEQVNVAANGRQVVLIGGEMHEGRAPSPPARWRSPKTLLTLDSVKEEHQRNDGPTFDHSIRPEGVVELRLLGRDYKNVLHVVGTETPRPGEHRFVRSENHYFWHPEVGLLAHVQLYPKDEGCSEEAGCGCSLRVLVDHGQASSEAEAIGTLVKARKARQGLDSSLDFLSNRAARRGPVEEGKAGMAWVGVTGGIEMLRTEVTVGQYKACAADGACSPPVPPRKDPLLFSDKCNWWPKGRADELPVDCVDVDQARSFCTWAGGRLPTRGEWMEEATSSGERKYPWGKAEPDCERAVWDPPDGGTARVDLDGQEWVVPTYRGEAGCGAGGPWPVCSKPSGNSLHGICDLSGNVAEWTSDEVVLSSGTKQEVVGGHWGTQKGMIAVTRSWTVRPASRTPRTGIRCVR